MRTKCRMPSEYKWELNSFHTKIANFNSKAQADGYMCIAVQAAGSIRLSAKCISLHSFVKVASLAYLELTSTFGNCSVWVKSKLEETGPSTTTSAIIEHDAYCFPNPWPSIEPWIYGGGGGAERLTDNYTIPKQRLFLLRIYEYNIYTAVFKSVLIWKYKLNIYIPFLFSSKMCWQNEFRGSFQKESTIAAVKISQSLCFPFARYFQSPQASICLDVLYRTSYQINEGEKMGVRFNCGQVDKGSS